MYKVTPVIAAALTALMVTGCGSSDPGPNLQAVLARANAAFSTFDAHMKKNNIVKATDQHMAQFNTFLQRTVNLKPAIYKTAIATSLLKDATFEGFSDANANGKVDAGEKKLFKVEVDMANKRLIATDASGQSTGRGFSGMGFLAGALIGNLMGRQRAAGIGPTHFNNRKMTSPQAYRRARSRARSGGLFRGK